MLDFGCVFNLNWSGFEFDKTNLFWSASKGTLEFFKIFNETTVKKNCSRSSFQHLALSHQTGAQTHQLQFILLRLYSANKRDNRVTKNSIAFKNERKSHVCASGFLLH